MHRRKSPFITTSLAELPLLRDAPRRELEVVASHTTPVSIAAGQHLCRQGQPGREAFIVVSGEADVTIDRTSVARLGPGAVCGEVALLDDGYRSATVVAVTAMEVLVLSVKDFASLLEEAPTVTRRLLAQLARRLREADGRLVTA